jgi:hypothetical protein
MSIQNRITVEFPVNFNIKNLDENRISQSILVGVRFSPFAICQRSDFKIVVVVGVDFLTIPV